MRGKNQTCKSCQCSWDKHMILKFECNPGKKKIVDMKQTNVRTLEEATKRLNAAMAEIEKQKVELEAENRVIEEAASIFAYVLNKNATLVSWW